MKRALLPAALLLIAAPAARADVVVRAPFVYVRAGQTIEVRAPFVHLVLPGRAIRSRVVSPASLKTPARQAQASQEPGALPPVPDVSAKSILPTVGWYLGKAIAGLLETRRTAAPPVTDKRAMTVKEFASTFKPSPAGGEHRVVLKHTFTGEPVKVRLSLPPGTPKKISAGKLRLVLRYPRETVVVRFYRDGRVTTTR
jgi:hypothetical protein